MNFITLARKMASKSPDPSTKVGCIITKKHGIKERVVASGYNTPLPIFNNVTFFSRSLKYNMTQHAEIKALLLLNPAYLKNTRTAMYITHPPCCKCAISIVESHINHIYIDSLGLNCSSKIRWQEEWRQSFHIFETCGTTFSVVPQLCPL